MKNTKYSYINQFQINGRVITVPCRIIEDLAGSYVIEYQSGNTYNVDKEEFEKLNREIKHFTSDVFPSKDD